MTTMTKMRPVGWNSPPLSASHLKELDIQGFIIFRGALRITEHDREALLRMARPSTGKTKVIFNAETEGDVSIHSGDGRRSQLFLDESPGVRVAQDVSRRFKAFAASKLPNHVPNSPVLIRSEPGCAVQPPHCDADLTAASVASACTTSATRFAPCAMLVAIQEGSYFDAWPNTPELMRTSALRLCAAPAESVPHVLVFLQPGDVILFRGDLVHAGSAYTKANTRFHMFLDHATIPRHPDVTFPIASMAPAVSRLLQIP